MFRVVFCENANLFLLVGYRRHVGTSRMDEVKDGTQVFVFLKDLLQFWEPGVHSWKYEIPTTYANRTLPFM